MNNQILSFNPYQTDQLGVALQLSAAGALTAEARHCFQDGMAKAGTLPLEDASRGGPDLASSELKGLGFTQSRTLSEIIPPSELAKKIKTAVELMHQAKRPLFYTGGGVINAGPEASVLLTELVRQGQVELRHGRRGA